jgi:hypothetical protein
VDTCEVLDRMMEVGEKGFIVLTPCHPIVLASIGARTLLKEYRGRKRVVAFCCKQHRN